MKYIVLMLCLISWIACNKVDTSVSKINSVDSNKWYQTYQYVGVLKASGIYDILPSYTLDTTMPDTFYVTVIAKDSLLISRNYFSYEAPGGIFRRYTEGGLLHVNADSTYYYHRKNFTQNAKLTSNPDAISWKTNDNGDCATGEVTSLFYGIKQ